MLEAAIVANALAHIGRVDLASYTGLAMVRATCWQVHGSNPVDAGWETARRLARLIFSTHTDSIIQKLESTELPSAAELIRAHGEAASLITHTVRCVRVVELISLFGLSEQEYRVTAPQRTWRTYCRGSFGVRCRPHHHSLTVGLWRLSQLRCCWQRKGCLSKRQTSCEKSGFG